MDNKKNKENTNQNITPVFWDENDGKWHFTEKCLDSEFQITYVTNPHTFETPDEAMQAYLEASKGFSEKMDQMKMQEAKIPTFAEELKTGIITYSCLQRAIHIAFVWDICCTIFCFRTLVKSEKNR